MSDDGCAGDRGSYGPKWAMVLDEPDSKHGSEVADRSVMTTAEQCSDLDQETARIRASGRVLRRQGEDHGEAKMARRRFTLRYHRIGMRSRRAATRPSADTGSTGSRKRRSCVQAHFSDSAR